MKLLYRVLKIVAVFFLVIITTLFLASFIMQDTVARIVLRSLNRDISTKYEFESVRLSYLKKFPNASLDLKNVLVHSSKGFDSKCFQGINTDTLLSAKSVLVEFSLADVVRGKYDIDIIRARDGRLNLFSDKEGNVNYDISVENEKDTGHSKFLLNLERIFVSGIAVTYNNSATNLIIKGIADNGRLKSRISDDRIDFAAEGGFRITLFSLNNYSISHSIPAEIDLSLSSIKSGIRFEKSTITLDNYLFALSGLISSDDILDLTLTGENINILNIKEYLPYNFRKRVSEYNPSGILNIEGKVKGLASRTVSPGININFRVKNGSVTYGNSELNVRDLSLEGSFTNGIKKAAETSQLSINEFKGSLGSSQYTGSLQLSNFDSLYLDLILRGLVKPSEVVEFFNIGKISSASGSIDMSLALKGYMPSGQSVTLADFFNMAPVADLKFNDFNIGFQDNRILINNVEGILLVSDTLVAKNLKVNFRNQKFSLTGTFLNFPGWMNGTGEILRGTAEVSCDILQPELLFPSLSDTDAPSGKKTGFHFPGDVIIDATLRTDSFKYKTFDAENVAGKVSYKPKILNFKSLTLNSMDGFVSGNGFIVQNADQSFIGRGSFEVKEVNVNKAFTSFKNFGQDFIVARNLAGSLSGSVSVLIPMDSLFQPAIKSITAEGKYLLERGALVDFDPVKELSSFIELSELQNIHFDKLENDFFIRNNFVYIPQMDVRSSAADLSVNGKHSFDNDYEYHVRILLSEALSKKLHKPKPNTTEFGAVQDDGLGRTALLLKIEDKGDDSKVSYDVKAAGAKVKNEIKSEKQNLKSILNKEFGWYKNDTAVIKPAATKPKRFKISWEETDSVKIE
jgi:hypothetical protein